jgi:hypothetical protein
MYTDLRESMDIVYQSFLLRTVIDVYLNKHGGNDMKAIKIKRCSDSLFWYRDLVGMLVPFLREDSDYFISREPAGYSNIVKKVDCEIVEVEKASTVFYTKLS